LDIAPTMLSRVDAHRRRVGVANISPMSPHVAAQLTDPVDLIFSYLTLQHIESTATVRRYLTLVEQWLAPDGVAWLQIDTRPRSFAYRVRNALPDFVLPQNWRRGMRRVRRCRRWVHGAIAESGLTVVRETGEGESGHVLIVRRGDQSAAARSAGSRS